MNHGLKINGNILEITLPENIHIDKVMVNRQIFSQRMQVCKSCKYHEKEGHEEPCVSCEVGNSNYVPSAEPEIKPISYTDCANAMLKMWIDNVLTDGEYNRIMDKLNAKYRGEQDE